MASWITKMQQQLSLMLRWRSFSGRSREHVAIIFASGGCQYLIHGCFQPIATGVTQDGKQTIIDAPLTLIRRIEQWPCRCLCCLYWLPVCPLYTTATKSLYNYCTYKINNCWRSIDPHYKVVCIHNLLPLIIAFIVVWTDLLPFCLINTRPFGKAEPSNSLALVTLIRLKFIHLAK